MIPSALYIDPTYVIFSASMMPSASSRRPNLYATSVLEWCRPSFTLTQPMPPPCKNDAARSSRWPNLCHLRARMMPPALHADPSYATSEQELCSSGSIVQFNFSSVAKKRGNKKRRWHSNMKDATKSEIRNIRFRSSRIMKRDILRGALFPSTSRWLLNTIPHKIVHKIPIKTPMITFIQLSYLKHSDFDRFRSKFTKR